MPEPKPEPKTETTPDQKDQLIKDMQAKLEALEKKLGATKPENEADPDLIAKAKKEREESEKKSGDARALEAAIKFNLNSEKWLKDNQALLPKEISDIFKAAESEKYDSPIEKDSAIKAGIIQSFFQVQQNMDLLTGALKSQLEDYLKLTKTGKQEKAQQMYDAIFEPTFEMLRRIKKAEALNKGVSDGSEDAFKQRMMKIARQNLLGERA
jgi:hypothetical protein